jgi:hypothetical protein
MLVTGATVWLVLANQPPPPPPPPACTVTAADGSARYTLTPDQTQNAATIAAVGLQVGMPDHAVTVALATALQESKLQNLVGGDRDSAGLFQQRPSQGWGTYAQVTDPIHASRSFYQRLRAQPGWAQLSVTQAAQLVQRSGAPDAYAQWEPQARALAGALTGETEGSLTCQNLLIEPPKADLAATATAELGTSTVSGPHAPARGWAISSWLVANAIRFGLDQVAFSGRIWTAQSGVWSAAGAPDTVVSLHQLSGPAPWATPSRAAGP